MENNRHPRVFYGNETVTRVMEDHAQAPKSHCPNTTPVHCRGTWDIFTISNLLTLPDCFSSIPKAASTQT
ncbi:hypothetical protein N7471_013736 [Penicillium samsonianum]|uniref:uncharacterized protein n=1 Tax=Penicillium samsonianum TaxID=1882272 RepID=UPI0025470438|nr:uncharacterized protein N7471_013736 [Penicillium samsonianum]KAJ6118269.1 hypothetical protein N7471_013736 [Penicillium samsonianum]